MNPQLEEILEKPVAVKLAILFGSLVIVGALFWFTVFQGLQTEYEEAQDQMEKLNKEFYEKTVIAKNLNSYRAEVQKLDVELAKALAELPDKKAIDLLLAKVSDKARDAGLDIKLFRPQSEQKKDFYAEVPVGIEVYGNYHQVGTFFDEVGNLERLVNLDEFTMEEPKKIDDVMTMKITAVATAFRFLDESERPKEKDGDKAKKRRGKAKADKKSEGEI